MGRKKKSTVPQAPEIDLVNPDPSIEIVKPTRSSALWDETREPETHEEKAYWDPQREKFVALRYCKHCTKQAIVTTNFGNHLRTQHSREITVDAKLHRESKERSQELNALFGIEDLNEVFETGRTRAEIVEHIFKTYLEQNKAKIRRALTEFVVQTRQSFHIVESPLLGTLLNCCNPLVSDFLPTLHNTISNDIMATFKKQKSYVQEALSKAYTRIHLSADIWTSPNRRLALGVIGTFVRIKEGRPVRTRLILGLKNVKGHAGEKQFDAAMPLLQELGIATRIGALVADNSTTNDTLCRALERAFKDLRTTTPWRARDMRVRCLGHIINLIVKSFLLNKEILSEEEEEKQDATFLDLTVEPHNQDESLIIVSQERGRKKKAPKKVEKLIPVLEKLHAIIVHSIYSANRAEEMRELAGRGIPVDVIIRWNTWFLSITIACKKQEAITKYTLNHSELQPHFLTDENWEELRTLRDFLQIFHEATLRAEGKGGSVGHHLLILNILSDCINDQMVSTTTFTTTFIIT